MWILLSSIPQEIIDQYELAYIEYNGWVYIKIQKVIPGLNQVGKIPMSAWKISGNAGCEPMHHTPELCKYTSHDIFFTLVVYAFGIKYSNRQDVEHLSNAFQLLCPMTKCWTWSKQLVLTLKWNYINRTVDLYMPNYVPAALHKFQHKVPENPQDAPHCWDRPTYGQATQHANPEDTSPILPPNKYP